MLYIFQNTNLCVLKVKFSEFWRGTRCKIVFTDYQKVQVLPNRSVNTNCQKHEKNIEKSIYTDSAIFSSYWRHFSNFGRRQLLHKIYAVIFFKKLYSLSNAAFYCTHIFISKKILTVHLFLRQSSMTFLVQKMIIFLCFADCRTVTELCTIFYVKQKTHT